jgi:flagellar hook-length control protein FliK
MEAIVLAPTSAPQVQTSSQSGQSNGDSETSFAPLLSQAIAKKDSGSGKAASTATASGATASGATASGATASTTTAGPTASPGQSREDMDIDSDADSDASEQFDLFLDAEPGSLNDYSALALMVNSNQVMPQQSLVEIKELLAETLSQGASVSLIPETTPQISIATVIPTAMAAQLNTPATASTEALQIFLDIPAAAGQTSPQPGPVNAAAQSQELSLTLTQLQELIANNETKGVVVQQQPQNAITLNELAGLTSQNLDIQPATSPTPAAVSETIEATTTASQFTARADIPANNSPSTQAPALRQDIHHQSLDGKLILNDSQDNKEGGKQTDQRGNDNNSAGQQATQILQAGTSSQGNPTAESALFSLPVQNSVTTQQTAHSGNTITLPSGTMVAEQEILNQVVQRFQMTSRLQNSKINLKLHPAELGELKINLTIKEGTIKASVFAQNQHVQEIIERNMPKLKSVLEQQGFTIDEIIVSSKSETIGNYDLFGEQFSNPQTFTSSDNANPSFSSFENVLDTSMLGANSSEAGLNVRA